MQIFILDINENKHTLEVETSELIGNIKNKVISKNIPINELVLYYNHKHLDDFRYLWEYNIQDGTIINITLRNIEIIINHSGERISLVVSTDETFKSIKTKVNEHRSYKGRQPFDDYFLYYNNILEDSDCFADYNIPNGSTISCMVVKHTLNNDTIQNPHLSPLKQKINGI